MSATRNDRPDWIVRGARVWTDGALRDDADAVAIAGGRIVAVGRAGDLGDAREVHDARGATLTPGLTDAHIHLLAWARSLDELDLTDATSAAEVARRAAAAAREGGVVVGRGWDEHRWPEPPHRALLDRVLPETPVLLHRHDFHALWVNGETLRRAGITRATRDPAGGVIERDAAGEPTGVLREHAVRLVAGLEPEPGEARDRERLRRAIALLHAQGVTAVHVFEAARSRRLLRELATGEDGALRVLMHLPHAALDAALAANVKSGAGDARFRIGAIKLFADGTLGSRTAALLAPYADTGGMGMELIAPGELREFVARGAAGGLATAIHAIGDRAVRSALDAFAAASEARARVALAARIEHVQLLDPADLPRFARLGVAASLQPTHAISDREVVECAWPDRRDRAYPWATLFAAGAQIAFGSDAPVEPADAPRTLHAAVTRTDAAGRPAGGWTPRERITLDRALTACTEGPSRLAGNWPALGRITPGAEADLVLWDRDLHATAPEQLRAAKAARTWIAGRLVHADERALEAGADAGVRGAA